MDGNNRGGLRSMAAVRKSMVLSKRKEQDATRRMSMVRKSIRKSIRGGQSLNKQELADEIGEINCDGYIEAVLKIPQLDGFKLSTMLRDIYRKLGLVTSSPNETPKNPFMLEHVRLNLLDLSDAFHQVAAGIIDDIHGDHKKTRVREFGGEDADCLDAEADAEAEFKANMALLQGILPDAINSDEDEPSSDMGRMSLGSDDGNMKKKLAAMMGGEGILPNPGEDVPLLSVTDGGTNSGINTRRCLRRCTSTITTSTEYTITQIFFTTKSCKQ